VLGVAGDVDDDVLEVELAELRVAYALGSAAEWGDVVAVPPGAHLRADVMQARSGGLSRSAVASASTTWRDGLAARPRSISA
jgi:hypothetical protein